MLVFIVFDHSDVNEIMDCYLATPVCSNHEKFITALFGGEQFNDYSSPVLSQRLYIGRLTVLFLAKDNT